MKTHLLTILVRDKHISMSSATAQAHPNIALAM
jgi:hypothetical protein